MALSDAINLYVENPEGYAKVINVSPIIPNNNENIKKRQFRKNHFRFV